MMDDVNTIENVTARMIAGLNRQMSEAEDMARAAAAAGSRAATADKNVQAIVYAWVPCKNGRSSTLRVAASEQCAEDMLLNLGDVAKHVAFSKRIKAAVGILLARDMSKGEW